MYKPLAVALTLMILGALAFADVSGAVGPRPVQAPAQAGLQYAEVSLFKGVIGKMIEGAVKPPEQAPVTPVNCKPIRGRPRNDERCRMA